MQFPQPCPKYLEFVGFAEYIDVLLLHLQIHFKKKIWDLDKINISSDQQFILLFFFNLF